MKKPVVIKIGGSLLGSPAEWETIAESVTQIEKPVVVVISAARKVTDRLESAIAYAKSGAIEQSVRVLDKLHEQHEQIAHTLLKNSDAYRKFIAFYQKEEIRVLEYLHLIGRTPIVASRLYDLILIAGERISAKLMTLLLSKNGTPSRFIDPRYFILIDRRPITWKDISADPVNMTKHLSPCLPHIVPVIPGFYGRTRSGRTLTFGRGGSDLTAALLAVNLRASKLIIWTDVPAIMTADPSLVPEAQPIRSLPYDIALVSTRFGVKKCHPLALEPVAVHEIPTIIQSPFYPGNPGTIIDTRAPGDAGPILLTLLRSVVFFTVSWKPQHDLDPYELMLRLKNRWSVEFMTVSQQPPAITGFIIQREPDCIEHLNRFAELYDVHVNHQHGSLVGIVGYKLDVRQFRWIIHQHPEIEILPWASERFIPLRVPEDRAETILNVLHERIIEGKRETPDSGSNAHSVPNEKVTFKSSDETVPPFGHNQLEYRSRLTTPMDIQQFVDKKNSFRTKSNL